MRIIDAHVHIGRRHLPIETVERVLERAGVQKAVVFADPESGKVEIAAFPETQHVKTEK